MGGQQCKSSQSPRLDETEAEVVMLMMPVYYTLSTLTSEELQSAKACWTMILTDTSPHFAELKRNPNFRHSSCITLFYSSFYERLFDVHPPARNLFTDLSTQGKFLVKMLSLALSENDDPAKYENTLIKLAEVHNERGVKAVEYGVVGEVLFWAIRCCVGVERYTEDLHDAWVKIYSRMLRTMVPVAVAHELRDGSAQAQRFLALSLEPAPSEVPISPCFESYEPDKGNSTVRIATTTLSTVSPL